MILTTFSPQSDVYSFYNTYSGTPENNAKWIRVDQKFGDFWFGKPVKELVMVNPYEFIRGEIPKSHFYGKTRKDIENEYDEYLSSNAMPYGKYQEYTFAEIKAYDISYFSWATDKEIIKVIYYDNKD